MAKIIPITEQILKSPPFTHVVDQNRLEDSISTQDIG
jgi:hypothetical protein